MESNESSTCPLCRHEKVKIYAVGECSHPVCHLCSTKMRILCEQTYCAICRQELPRVYLISDITMAQPKIDESRFTPIDDTGDCGIYYPIKTEWIRRETEKLLRNFCPFCPTEYETFDILREHVRRTHRFFYCDLCVEHLNLFPYERKCYTRQDLVQHIRCGDRDDTSFKGHPLCRFCDDHFLDVDQLYKHMRKEHYYCHLCTNDNIYYSDFDLLRDHYRSSHYLCEIGQCKDVQFTNVFSSEIDFRAHQAAQHSKNRAEARQLGTIPVAFSLANTRDRKPHDPAHRGTFKSGEFRTQGTNNSSRNERDDSQQEPAVPVAVPSIDEFPTLNENLAASQTASQQRGAWGSDLTGRINSYDEFPALASAAPNIATNANTAPVRGKWKEPQQPQQPRQIVNSSSSSNLNAMPKKVPSAPSNAAAPTNTIEDFPALQTSTHSRATASMSAFSAWSTAKKSGKHPSASAKANQPPMRLNTNRLIRDDDDDEYIRRPMTSLTTSTVPTASSNISMISASELPSAQNHEKKGKNKKQALPNAHDFPALPTTNTTSITTSVSSTAWGNDGTSQTGESTPKKQTKNSAGKSKKKFLEELQTMPPSMSSTTDFPTMGLKQLGQRLIVEENQSSSTVTVNKNKPPSPTPPPSSANNHEKKEDTKSTAQPKKKAQKETRANDMKKQETATAKEEVSQKSTANEVSSKPVEQHESLPQTAASETPVIPLPSNFTMPSVVPPPPGFAASLTVAPPPGFIALQAQQPAPPSFIPTSSFAKQKDEFRTKLFTLFDGDMNLFTEYEKFCEAFADKNISTNDFLNYTTQLFKEKFDELLPELIVIIPSIEQQNELYSSWKKSAQSTESSSQTKTNWAKKTLDKKDILHMCSVCRQILHESDVDEHNSHHTEFNSQFPSLPAAAVPMGRGSGKKKK